MMGICVDSRSLRGWARSVLAWLAAAGAVLCVCAGTATAAPFGIEHLSVQLTEGTAETTEISQNGHPGPVFENVPYRLPLTQAGAHPWGLTVTLALTGEVVKRKESKPFTVPTQDIKDFASTLPPGLLGNPMAVPRCSLTYVTSNSEQCPADTQVGYYLLRLQGGHQLLAPIVDVAPEAGQSAEFAFENTVKFDTPLATGHLMHTATGYELGVVGDNLPLLGIQSVEATFWGVPAAASHDRMRGLICKRPEPAEGLVCQGGDQTAGVAPQPFLTLPTNCAAGPSEREFVARADSWEEPGKVEEGRYVGYSEAGVIMPPVTGCQSLRFSPAVEVHPATPTADEPTGLEVDLRVPLAETPESTATPQLRNTEITLPHGMSVSPGAVDGIRACQEFGPEGINITGPESEEIGLSGELQLAPGHCPNASAIGTAEAITPFLPGPVKGHVYLARPGCGGAGQPACTPEDARNGTLYRLYLELGGTGELALTGVHFKVPLETSVDLATGQITTRTLGTPQVPFSELKIHLNPGPRAPIDTPSTCGPAVTNSDLRPWSGPGRTPEGLLVGGTPDAIGSSVFDVIGCASPPGLHPGFLAGTVSPQAGQYSAFTLNLSRNDREQFVRGLQVHTPPGLLGMLSSVSLCREPLANEGTCLPSAKIGSTRVASGAGSHPFEIEGEVFLTGPYEGAPFGLSVVTHVVAGPFNLGLVVVRARIEVDPSTSALTVTTDETGPHALPSIVFGVPLRLKRISVNIDRPNFMFNPTNCSAQKVTAEVSGFEGATSEVSTPLAAAGCTSLAFEPKFSISTSGHTSRRRGASLDVKLSYPAGSLGRQANLARVKVSLPKQLPTYLPTLKDACLAATFEADPSACPSGSIVGIARASTPLLPVGLLGPAYFVSHGGAEFPSLVIVLQGDGVRVDLVGSTFIKKGVTSSTFKTVPDVPVNTFELYLPQGNNHALAANGNLCRSAGRLKMPTEFVAQNGAVIQQNTKIAVQGCSAGHSKAQRARTGSRRGA